MGGYPLPRVAIHMPDAVGELTVGNPLPPSERATDQLDRWVVQKRYSDFSRLHENDLHDGVPGFPSRFTFLRSTDEQLMRSRQHKLSVWLQKVGFNYLAAFV